MKNYDNDLIMGNQFKEKDATLAFPKVLTRLLKERSISKKQAASLAGVPNTVMFDWCQGKAPRDLLAVRRLAKALGCSTSYLLYGETDNFGLSVEEILQAEDKPTLSGLYQIEFKKVKINEHLLKKEK